MVDVYRVLVYHIEMVLLYLHLALCSLQKLCLHKDLQNEIKIWYSQFLCMQQICLNICRQITVVVIFSFSIVKCPSEQALLLKDGKENKEIMSNIFSLSNAISRDMQEDASSNAIKMN